MKLGLIILTLALIIGCSSEKASVKPPSAESLRVKGAIEILLRLSKAYESKDVESFMHYISPLSLSNIGYLEKRIKSDFNTYEKISINITLRWAKVKEDSIQLAAQWEGTWYDHTGKELRDRGNAVFSFKNEGDLKLIRIDGDSPFGISE
jgi:hypothetical protein